MISEDFSLIKKAQKGDIKAFEALIFKYDKLVLNIAYSYSLNGESAKDIYQDVFLRVFKGIRGFKFNSKFSTWLYRITANVCITFIQKNKKESVESIDKEVSIDGESAATLSAFITDKKNIAKEVETNELVSHIKKIVGRLPAQQKMAFALKYYNNYKISEISDMMNCGEGTIKRYLFMAMGKVQTELKSIIQT